jgi:hypothetical protein
MNTVERKLIPLELEQKHAFIPLSRGGYCVGLGDYMLLDSILGYSIPLFKRPTFEGNLFGVLGV